MRGKGTAVFAVAVGLSCVAVGSAGGVAQDVRDAPAGASDLRQIHALVVHTMVRIRTQVGIGTGWLLAQRARPLVITNRHVVQATLRDGRVVPVPTADVFFYTDSEHAPVRVTGRVMHRSTEIDLAIIRLDADPPPQARAHPVRTDVTVMRGERVVLGGNPSTGVANPVVLSFQTTEGVVTGRVPGDGDLRGCGAGRNCVVVDAASLAGSSGGPAFNFQGQLVGMLWSGPQLVASGDARALIGRRPIAQNPTLAYLIHARAIGAELRSLEVAAQDQRTTRP